jgi:predicted acylesterase/phospholipase RssA
MQRNGGVACVTNCMIRGDQRGLDTHAPAYHIQPRRCLRAADRAVPQQNQIGWDIDWVRASAAIPGVFPPILNQGSVHVDGGVLDNLPISTMRRSGVSSVVAVNVGLDEPISASSGLPGVLELLKRVGTIGSDAKLGSGSHNCDHLVRPDVGHIGLLDWRSHQEAIEAGYNATMRQFHPRPC